MVSDTSDEKRLLVRIPSIIVTSESSPALLSVGHISSSSRQLPGGSVEAGSVTVEPAGIDWKPAALPLTYTSGHNLNKLLVIWLIPSTFLFPLHRAQNWTCMLLQMTSEIWLCRYCCTFACFEVENGGPQPTRWTRSVFRKVGSGHPFRLLSVVWRWSSPLREEFNSSEKQQCFSCGLTLLYVFWYFLLFSELLHPL